MSEFLKEIPIYLIYVLIAVVGGMARYFNSFADGKIPFKLSIFFASAFAAGFSGMMFALLGDSFMLPNPLPHIMAGVGGFFGEQTMKLVLEYTAGRVGSKTTQQ